MLAASPYTRRRQLKAKAFGVLCFSSLVIAGLLLLVLLGSIWKDGAGRLSMQFLTSFPSSIAKNAGIKAGLMGTLWVIALTTLISVPIGVAAAVFLEELNPRQNRFTRFVQLNIANLAGVPSIVYRSSMASSALRSLSDSFRWAAV